jgi:hypothetical protein
VLLGGRKVVCSAGERWSARRERAVLLGARVVDCYVGEGCAARR